MESSLHLERLVEEITCPLCLEIFSDPKVLPCQHVYCRSPCLVSLAQETGYRVVKCPECRVDAQIPGDSVSGFPTAFHVNRLKEVVQGMQTATLASMKWTSGLAGSDGKANIETTPTKLGVCVLDTPSLPARGTVSACGMHPSQPLDFCCITCSQLVCKDCLRLDFTVHANHTYDLVGKVAASYRQAMCTHLDRVQQIQVDMAHAMKQVGQVKRKVVDQGVGVDSKIKKLYDGIITVVQQQKQALQEQVQEITEEKLGKLSSQEQHLEEMWAKLNDLVHSVRDATEDISDETLLTLQGDMILKISELTAKCAHLPLRPVATADMAVQVVSPKRIAGLCSELSSIYTLAAPSQCKVRGVSDVGETNKVSSFLVHLADSSGSACSGEQAVTAELKSLKFGSVTKAQVVPRMPSSYEISYKPDVQTRGKCELSVKVNGAHISGSPFKLYIKCPPNQLGTPLQILNHIFSPEGIRIGPEDKLYVASHKGSEISVFDNTLIKIQSIALPYEWGPAELAFDQQQNVYVSDFVNHQIHKFSSDGTHLKVIGGLGTFPGQFQCPNGLKFINNNTLLVCDSDNHRIQFFDSELNFLRCFGEQGKEVGQFDWPDALDVDEEGFLYVTDYNNARVQVVHPSTGQCVRSFGKRGEGPGEFCLPNCIQVVGQFVFITDPELACVSVFHTSGIFIHQFGKDTLEYPNGIAIDSDGFVYVADTDDNRILIY